MITWEEIEFPQISEAKRLMEAKTNLTKVLELEKQLAEKERESTGAVIHMISTNLRRAMDEVEAANATYYAATGEQTLPLPLPLEEMDAFQRSVEHHFGTVALAVNSKLERLMPWLYGFVAPHAIVTIGVYHGHSPSVCVKLRERQPSDTLMVCDGRDIGLANLVAFVDPSAFSRNTWKDRPHDVDLRFLAAKLSQYGQPFLIDPKADWAGLRSWTQQKTEKALSEMPWLARFGKS